MAKRLTAEAAAAKAAFETRFPRLRLKSLNLNTLRTIVSVSIAGPGDELIAIGLISQSTIDAMPPCGVKVVYESQGVGPTSTVYRIQDGYRVSLSIDDEDRIGAYAKIYSALCAALNLQFAEKEAASTSRDLGVAIFDTAQQWKEKHHMHLRVRLNGLGNHWRPATPDEQESYEAIFGDRFQFAAADVQRFDSIIHRFRNELKAAIDRAAVVDLKAKAPPASAHLHLVVKNMEHQNG